MKRLLALLPLSLALMAGTVSMPAAQAQTRELPDFADLVERTGPAVVNIRTTERARANQTPSAGQPQMPEGLDENDPFYEFFRPDPATRHAAGAARKSRAVSDPGSSSRPTASCSPTTTWSTARTRST